jgi:hypothetical protein
MRYEKRLNALARRAGLCHVHLTPFVCVRCEARRGDPVWNGTDAELEEFLALTARTDAYDRQIPAAGVCPLFGCGGQLFCEPCYNAAAAKVRVPDDVYTADEWQRLYELSGLADMRRK